MPLAPPLPTHFRAAIGAGFGPIGFGFFLLLYGIRFFAFDEVKYGTMFMILPIVSPMVWLLRYFILGEYATLFINI